MSTAENCVPFLRWAGSKRRLLPKLTPYWSPAHTRYVEPFAGSAALFYSINPPNAILSDINEELMHALTIVRDQPLEVYEQLTMLRRGRKTFEALRRSEPRSMNATTRGARFIFLNRFCFNGLYRTNLRGEFNVPFASSKTGEIPPREVFLRSAGRLRCAELLCDDFERVIIERVQAGDFVYLDPPYAVGNRRVFRQSALGLQNLARVFESFAPLRSTELI